MNSDQWKSLLRGLIISGGAALVSKGLASHSQLAALADEAAGAVVTGAPIIWAMAEKRYSKQLTKAVSIVNLAVEAGDATHVPDPTSASGQTVVKTP